MRKLAVSLADSIDLRVILSVLYIITEVMREELRNIKHSDYKDNVEAFKEDLGMSLRDCVGSRLLGIKKVFSRSLYEILVDECSFRSKSVRRRVTDC